jgi:hypothetical protein
MQRRRHTIYRTSWTCYFESDRRTTSKFGRNTMATSLTRWLTEIRSIAQFYPRSNWSMTRKSTDYLAEWLGWGQSLNTVARSLNTPNWSQRRKRKSVEWNNGSLKLCQRTSNCPGDLRIARRPQKNSSLSSKASEKSVTSSNPTMLLPGTD